MSASRLDVTRGVAMMGSAVSLRQILATVALGMAADLPTMDAPLQ